MPNASYKVFCDSEQGLFYLFPLISSVVTLLVMITYLLTGIFKEKLGQMTFAIILANFLHCAPLAILTFTVKATKFSCVLWQLISVFGTVSVFFWTSFFAISILILLKQRNLDSIDKAKRYFLAIGTITPFVLTLAVVPMNYTGLSSDSVCTHRFIQGAIDYGFLVSTLIPLTAAFLVSLLCYSYIYRAMRGGPSSSKERMLLFLYPTVLLVCWLPMIAVHAYFAMGNDVSQMIVYIAQGISYSQGLLHCVIYGGSKRLFDGFRSVFKCCAPKHKESLMGLSLTSGSNSDTYLGHTSVPIIRSVLEFQGSLLQSQF